MDSAKGPAPLQQHSNNLVCDICNIQCESPEHLNSHYGEQPHKTRLSFLAQNLGLSGRWTKKHITCLDDIFNDPHRMGILIGLQYLREVPRDQGNPSFYCRLCDAECFTLFHHAISLKHKKSYIQKHFSFLFGNIENLPLSVIAKIVVIIQDVEGIQKFKTSIENPIEDYPCRETINKIVEQLQKHKIDFKNPYQEGNTVPFLATGSHSSGTNDKKTIINPSVPSEPSAASEYSTRQEVNDKITKKVQIHGIGFKDAYQKENTVSCLETGSLASGINESTGKRPSQFTPLAAFKRSKSDKMHDMAPKPIPSLCRSYQSSSRWPTVEENVHSWQLAEPFYQKAEYGFRSSDQSLYDFANTSVYGQANSVSDVGQAYAVEGQTWGQETGHPGAKHLHTLEMTGGSVSSPEYPSGQCFIEASLNRDTPSRYDYNSVDSKELSSKSYLPSGIMSVLNKEPSSPTSRGAIHHSEGLPPTTSTSSCVQTSQSTNSSMPAKTASVLSPDTLKILQGRDPTSVKSILKRLAEYCPELQQVNISLLVDVLFETGALR